MARKDASKRTERMEKNNHRMNLAMILFTIGFVAEFYLLQVSNYYVKGTVEQLVAAATFLEVMVFVGLAVVAAGLVLFALREKKAWCAKLCPWVLGLGVFLTLSSQLMRRVYPAGTTIMCVLVPVLMIMSVVYLLYPAEFSVEATALVATTGLAALVSHNTANAAYAMLLSVLSVVAALALIAAVVGVNWLKKNDGAIKNGETSVVVFSAKTNYALMSVVLLLSAAAILAAAFVAGAAYFILWGGAIAMFILAVLHTVKML